jgi:hypothetical protein
MNIEQDSKFEIIKHDGKCGHGECFSGGQRDKCYLDYDKINNEIKKNMNKSPVKISLFDTTHNYKLKITFREAKIYAIKINIKELSRITCIKIISDDTIVYEKQVKFFISGAGDRYYYNGIMIIEQNKPLLIYLYGKKYNNFIIELINESGNPSSYLAIEISFEIIGEYISKLSDKLKTDMIDRINMNKIEKELDEELIKINKLLLDKEYTEQDEFNKNYDKLSKQILDDEKDYDMFENKKMIEMMKLMEQIDIDKEKKRIKNKENELYNKKNILSYFSKLKIPNTCPICCINYSNIVKPMCLNPCGHCCCEVCIKNIKECMICRSNILNIIKIYL